jgi:hypothetical protein
MEKFCRGDDAEKRERERERENREMADRVGNAICSPESQTPYFVSNFIRHGTN